MIQFKLGSVVLACGAAGGVGISLQGDDDNTAYGDKLDTIPEGTFPPNECEFEVFHYYILNFQNTASNVFEMNQIRLCLTIIFFLCFFVMQSIRLAARRRKF